MSTYVGLELEVIAFCNEDVITESDTATQWKDVP